MHLDNITEHYGYTIICQDVTTLRKRAKKRDVPQIPLNVFGGLKPRYRYDTIKEIDCYVKYTQYSSRWHQSSVYKICTLPCYRDIENVSIFENLAIYAITNVTVNLIEMFK